MQIKSEKVGNNKLCEQRKFYVDGVEGSEVFCIRYKLQTTPGDSITEDSDWGEWTISHVPPQAMSAVIAQIDALNAAREFINK